MAGRIVGFASDSVTETRGTGGNSTSAACFVRFSLPPLLLPARDTDVWHDLELVEGLRLVEATALRMLPTVATVVVGEAGELTGTLPASACCRCGLSSSCPRPLKVASSSPSLAVCGVDGVLMLTALVPLP